LFDLLFDSSKFLAIANQLLGDASYRGEAAWRTAIGRAYYAAFLASKKRLEERGCNFSDVAKIHQEVIQNLMSRKSDTANKLNTLFEKRVNADYYMDVLIDPSIGAKCAKIAQMIIDELHSV
jgi:uncharacterized protein (UPF0332 family)